MEEFPCDDAALQPLFSLDLPNSPALWAVLKGNYAGKALVDDYTHPRECVLRTEAALTYFGRNTSQAFLARAIEHFQHLGPVWLVWPHQTDLQPPERSSPETIPRLEFFDIDPDSESLRRLRQQLPNDLQIRGIDAEIFEHCLWREEMTFYAGSAANFLMHGIGVCLMKVGRGHRAAQGDSEACIKKSDQILAEAYASAMGKTRAEIGAITKEAFRSRGYAPIACAYLIEECRRRGYQAYWSCDGDNDASIRVAQKLGFRQMRAYKIYDYPQLA